jgi:Phage ABA sandwich domain
MKWSEMSDKDKVKLILQHVLSYEHIEEMYAGMNLGLLSKFPVALWNRKISQWQIGDVAGCYPRQFDPLRNMNDAWQIVEKLHEKYDVCLMVKQGEVQQKYFFQLYDRNSHETQDGMQSNISMQDTICLAALDVCGVEIEA